MQIIHYFNLYTLMRKGLLFLVALVFMLCTNAMAQSTVSGKVTSAESGEALIGVNIAVKGTSTGTVSDTDGNYTLQMPDGATTLVFSFVGFSDQEIEIGSQTTINISMKLDNKFLDEVVVVGYGEQSTRLSIQSTSKVNSDKFENMPVVSPQELLQGQAAGVQMVGASGVLGSNATIRVRGVASLNAGSSPLYVVDGVPLNDGEYSNGQGADALNPIADLNPNDIESMTVLKDAAAVAIYGSRGANGVILITTKKGKSEKTSISLDYFTGMSNVTNLTDMMDADEYRTYRNEYRVGQGASAVDFGNDPTFAWRDEVIRTGKTNSYSLSAAGGSEKTKFYLGGTYFNQSSYTIGNEVDRLNARLNLSHQANDKIRFGANIAVSQMNNDRINSDNSTFAPLTSSLLQIPYVQAYNEDGSFTNTGFIANVLAIEALSTRMLISKRTTANAYASWDVIKGLTLKTDFGIDLVQTEETIRDPEIVSPGGYGYKRVLQDNKWLNSTTLNYTPELSEDHYVNVLLGTSYETSEYQSIAVEGSGFVSDQLPNVGSAATPTLTSSTGSGWALASTFGRLNYRFKDKYLFEASLRRDGSSRFGANNRFGTFWAVSAGWLLIEEDFIKNLDIFDDLKIKASYGTSGNDRISNFGALGLYGGGVDSDYAGIAGLRPTQADNPNLSWEETAQFDFTLNASFLDNRVSVEASYWNKNSTGLLISVPLPYTTGFASILQNIGKMQNTGVDLLINTTNVQNNGFTWTTSLNMGFLKNQITELPDDNVDDLGNNFIPGTTSQRAVQGKSVNEFFLIRYKGINAETGDAEWLTKDGEVTTSPSAGDRVYVGSAIPTLTGGFTNNFRYKGLDLNVFFNFTQGNKVMDRSIQFTDNVASGFNKRTKMLDYWKQPGDNTHAPSMSSPTARLFAQSSSAQLMDGSFIRLRNVSLGYSLPKEILDKTKFLTKARFYVMGQNLWTITNYQGIGDPELNGLGADNLAQGESFFTPPQAQTYTFGVSLGF